MYRSLLVSLLLIGAVTTLITQTGASFVDSATSTSSNFTAGKVDLQVNWGGNTSPCSGLDGIQGFIAYKTPKMLPGDSVTQSLAVLNPDVTYPSCVSTYSTLPLRYSATSYVGVSIASSTATNPTTITTVSQHGLSKGDVVTIVNHTSTPALSGPYTVDNVTANSFTIPVASSGATGGQTGSVLRYNESLLAAQLVLTIKYNKHTTCDAANWNNLPNSTISSATASGSTTTITTLTALTNLANNDQVVITGSSHYNGTFTITKTGTNTFTIPMAFLGTSAGTATVQDAIAYQGGIGAGAGQKLWGNGTPGISGDRIIPLSQSDNLCFNVALPASSSDIYQNVSSTLTIQFNAQQTTNNP